MTNSITFEDILSCTRRAIEIHYPFNSVLEAWDRIYQEDKILGVYKNLINDPLELAFLLRAIEVGDGKEYIIVATATKLAFSNAKEYYTPTIEDFYDGIEYEFKERFTDGTVKTLADYESAKWVKAVYHIGDKPYIERALTGKNSKTLPPAIRIKNENNI